VGKLNYDYLEARVFYRLVKVMYVLFLAVGLVGVICIGWSFKPYQLVDSSKSYLTCPDGTKHSFDSFFIFKREFYEYKIKDGLKICKKHLADNHDLFEQYRVPPLHIFYKTKGSWILPIEIGFFGSLIIFLILNVIKQSLLYIVYGKKFTLGWWAE
jgi:hypothetical protein